MTRTEYWLLNGLSAILIGLLLAHLSLSRTNSKLGVHLNSQRAYINNARQLEPVLENLVRRIDAGGQSDVQLKALLTKYDIKVNRPTEPKTAETPQKSGRK